MQHTVWAGLAFWNKDMKSKYYHFREELYNFELLLICFYFDTHSYICKNICMEEKFSVQHIQYSHMRYHMLNVVEM